MSVLSSKCIQYSRIHSEFKTAKQCKQNVSRADPFLSIFHDEYGQAWSKTERP